MVAPVAGHLECQDQDLGPWASAAARDMVHLEDCMIAEGGLAMVCAHALEVDSLGP